MAETDKKKIKEYPTIAGLPSLGGIVDSTKDAFANTAAGIANLVNVGDKSPDMRLPQSNVTGEDVKTLISEVPSALNNQRNQAASGTLGASVGQKDFSGTAAISGTPNTKTSLLGTTPDTATPTTPSTVTPSLVTQTLGDLGKGGGNTLSFSNGVGGSGTIKSNQTFSPDQLSSLDKTIEYNNRPEVIANFAKQAAISQARYDEYNKGRERDNLLAKLESAKARDDQKGTALYKDLLLNRDKNAIDREQIAGILSKENSTNQRAMLGLANEAAFKSNKNLQERDALSVNILKDLDKEGASVFQKIAAVKKGTGKLTLGDFDQAYGNDSGYLEARRLGDPKALADYIGAKEDAPPLEYINEAFQNSFTQ
jgi:hypothetical protein